MKHILTILALVLTVGVAHAAKPEGQAPEKGAKKGGDRKGPARPEGVDEATWKKFQDAMKAAQNDDAVKAAKAKAAEAKTEEEKREAGKAVREATKAAVLKADASLAEVFAKLEAANKGKGGDKGKGGEKKKKKAE
ncbi:MAG: hypothetical protein ACO3ND_02855 [Opitutales bacterium]